MALDLNSQTPLRRYGDLVRLVNAVVEAEPHDEPAWLEWKGRLDLSTAQGRFSVAKAVLGIANRMPDAAAPYFEGVGYVVVGAEAGNVYGVEAIDPAQLDDGMSPYIGGLKGPTWSSIFVTIDDKQVLVVTVEAPKWGDPIHPLRKGFNNHQAGTVFVRRPGKTTPATDHDLDLLQERLTASELSPLQLEITLVGDVPISWFDPSSLDEGIDRWVEARRAKIIAAAEAVERSRTAGIEDTSLDAELKRAASQISSMKASSLFIEEDTRSLNEFISETDEWAERLLQAARDDWLPRYLEAGNGLVRLRARNLTHANYADVRIMAQFSGDEVTGVDEYPISVRLPAPPRPFGQSRSIDPMASLMPSVPTLGVDAPHIAYPKSTWVEDGSVRIGWDVGDMRPQEIDESDDVHLLVRERPDDGVLRGQWEATSKSVDGVATGDLTLRVEEEPIEASKVL